MMKKILFSLFLTLMMPTAIFAQSMTDDAVMAYVKDGVKQGKTQKLAVKRAVELLNLAHANLLGYVMNDVNADGDSAYGYGYGYGYGEDANK